MCIFETERLTVRKLVRANLSDFQRLQGSAGVMRYITGIPHTHTPQESARDLAEIIARYDIEDNNIWIWAVFTKSGDFIGTCALFENEEQEFEIAYRLLETCWGQGYGQETANGLIDYSLDELRLNTIVAQTASDNLASVRILARSRLTFVADIENKEKHWMERHYRYADIF
jgi:RimJ/RimL family protein N-acetyltransferase